MHLVSQKLKRELAVDKDLKEAVIELVLAQKQTTKNIDELRSEFKEVMLVLGQVGVLNQKISSAHRRIDEQVILIKELINRSDIDIDKLNAKIDKIVYLWITTLISSVGALVLILIK